MRKEVKLGIIACIIIAATFLAVDFLKGKDLFTNDIKLHTSYSSVEGLSVSTPVTIQGYKVGNITEMSYDPQQRIYNISFTVLSEFDIPNDSYLEVYSSDILGSKALRIILGSSAEYFTSGESIKGETAAVFPNDINARIYLGNKLCMILHRPGVQTKLDKQIRVLVPKL